MKSEKITFKDNYFYLFVIIVSLLFIAIIIPNEVQSGKPRIFPYAYTFIIFLTATVTFIKNIIMKTSKEYTFNKKVVKFVGIALFIYLIYTAFIEYVGYFAMSILFMVVLLRYLGESWRTTIILSIVIPGSIYLIFTRLLLLYFPEGILF